MRQAFLVISGVLTAGCIIPYMLDTLKGKTKPRIVTWFNWSLLTGISTAAMISDKQYPSAVLSGAGAIACGIVVILALKYGDRKFELLDIVCQLGAILGLILWAIFNSPLVAIIASTTLDFIVALPTFKHSWQKPHEETFVTYALTIVAALLALGATEHPKVAGLVFPIYIVLLNIGFVTVLSISPHRRRKI